MYANFGELFGTNHRSIGNIFHKINTKIQYKSLPPYHKDSESLDFNSFNSCNFLKFLATIKKS